MTLGEFHCRLALTTHGRPGTANIPPDPFPRTRLDLDTHAQSIHSFVDPAPCKGSVISLDVT